MSKNPKFIPLETVRTSRLIFPNSKLPLTYRNTLRILERLNIEAQKFKIDGQGQPIQHVTPEQAEEIAEEFKRTHWKKFKAEAK